MTIGASNSVAAGRRIRLGMVGGGEGAFIGAVHRIAARLDDHYELVAGALASDPTRAQRSAPALGLADERIYADYAAMAQGRSRARRRHRGGRDRHARTTCTRRSPRRS